VEPINYESAIALSKFDKGQLQEVRIYPIWARHDGPLSRRGLPMTAPPEIAQRILQRLQKLSEPPGTRITIQGTSGLNRPAAERPDLVVIQVYITSARRAYRIADHYRSRGAFVALGGLHVTSLPDEAAEHADAVFLGPGEQTFPRFLDDLRAGRISRLRSGQA